ncbi:MAG: SulP family inorganic anion transporter [Rubritepida sp.]|nr:SulP family inorganic anion transporter [Rubritepida sp.]
MTAHAAAARATPATTVPPGKALGAGAISAIWTASNALAYAGLIYSGAAAGALSQAVSGLLLGLAALAAVVAWGAGARGMAAAVFGGTAVVCAAAVQAVEGHLAARAIVGGAARDGALVLASGAITLATGLTLAVVGALRIGSLVRLLPHPVSAGFFCGLGAAFCLSALKMVGGTPLRPEALLAGEVAWKLAACGGVTFLLLVLPRLLGHWAVMPGILVAATLAYHGARLANGQSVAQAQAAGWLLGPFASAAPLNLPPRASLALFDAELLLLLLPYAGSAALLTAITLALMVTGIETSAGRRLDVDREMMVAGFGNALAGAAGGLPGGPAMTTTSMLAKLGARSRLAAATTALVALALLALGPDVLGLLPRPVLAALLLSYGLDWMILRTWRESRAMPLYEAAIMLVVAATMVSVGVVEGLTLGLGLALLIFAWTYRGLPVVRSTLRGDEMRSSVTRTGAASQVLEREGHRIVLFRLQGYLFFLNAEAVERAFTAKATAGARFVILDFRHVLGMDSSAIAAFRRLEQEAAQRSVVVLLSALPPSLDTRLAAQGVFRSTAWLRVPSADRGLEQAEERLLAEMTGSNEDQPVTLAAFLASLASLPDLERRLGACSERFHCEAGVVLMRQGEPADDMIFVEHGRVVVSLEEAGREPMHLRTLTPGTLVGEVAMVRDGTRTASVYAETACVGQRLTRAAMRRMEVEDPELARLLNRAIMLQLAEKLADNTRAVELALR